jgi:hypothetical protein
MPDQTMSRAKILAYRLPVKKKMDGDIDLGGCRDQECASRRGIGRKVAEIVAKIGKMDYIKEMSVILFFAGIESWNDDQFFSVRIIECR